MAKNLTIFLPMSGALSLFRSGRDYVIARDAWEAARYYEIHFRKISLHPWTLVSPGEMLEFHYPRASHPAHFFIHSCRAGYFASDITQREI